MGRLSTNTPKRTKYNRLPQIVAIGYTNIDINITPRETTTLPGGGAYFVALAASLITKSVGLVTRVGNDYDTSFLHAHVLADGIHVIPKGKTAKSTQFYHSMTDLTDRDITLEWGVAPDINPNDIPPRWIKTAKIFHVATMPPLQQQRFIQFIRKIQPDAYISLDTDKIFLDDPSSKTLIEENIAHVDMIFVNRLEYAKLKHVVMKCREAIVKFDKDGAVYFSKGKKIAEAKAKRVRVKDATGAGDILAGAYLAARIQGVSLSASLSLATETATESIRKIGISHLFT